MDKSDRKIYLVVIGHLQSDNMIVEEVEIIKETEKQVKIKSMHGFRTIVNYYDINWNTNHSSHGIEIYGWNKDAVLKAGMTAMNDKVKTNEVRLDMSHKALVKFNKFYNENLDHHEIKSESED